MNEYRPPAEEPPTERFPRVRPPAPSGAPWPPRQPPPPREPAPPREPPSRREPPPPREPPQVIRRPPGWRPPPAPMRADRPAEAAGKPIRYPPPPPPRSPAATPPTPGRPAAPPYGRPAQPPRRRPVPPEPALTRVAASPPAQAPRIPAGQAPKRPGTRNRAALRRRIIRAALAVVLVLTAATLGVGIWVETSLRRIAVFADYPDRPPAGAGTNWLLVGSDSRTDLTEKQQAELSTGGEVGNGRTDTILLVHIPSLFSTEPTSMVSIPRDSYVEIPGWGMDKINAAFAEGGPALLAQTVERATGLRLDHYAEVGFAGFGDVVDALGGVTMCPSEPMNDPLAGIDLPAGCQVLDGPSALGYVRSRATARADLDRMAHQREFMSAMLHRAATPTVWLNPWRWYAFPHSVLSALTVNTDVHVWSLAALGWALHDAVTTVTVPIGEFTGNSAGSVLIWDAAAASALFEALRTDAPIPQQVLDGQP